MAKRALFPLHPGLPRFKKRGHLRAGAIIDNRVKTSFPQISSVSVSEARFGWEAEGL